VPGINYSICSVDVRHCPSTNVNSLINNPAIHPHYLIEMLELTVKAFKEHTTGLDRPPWTRWQLLSTLHSTPVCIHSVEGGQWRADRPQDYRGGSHPSIQFPFCYLSISLITSSHSFLAIVRSCCAPRLLRVGNCCRTLFANGSLHNGSLRPVQATGSQAR
jgi:hypothetical protein